MKAIIEMPKGDNRRRHIKSDKSGFVDLGLIKDIIPVNEGIMPIHYGYISETLNKKEGDEIDVLIFSNDILHAGEEIEINPIGLLKREDGDDKVVAVRKGNVIIKKYNDIPEQERDLIERFFSFHHKIIDINDSSFAKEYIEQGYQDFLKT